jgi:hypothetical protein
MIYVLIIFMLHYQYISFGEKNYRALHKQRININQIAFWRNYI